MEPKNIARIIISLSLDRAFDYLIPEKLLGKIRVGSRVKVPFGRGTQIGYVIDLPQKSTVDKLKEISLLLEEREILSPKLLELGKWMSSYYCCTQEQAVKSLLPAVVRHGTSTREKIERVVHLKDSHDLPDILIKLERRAPRQADVIKKLLKRHSLPLALLVKLTKISYQGVHRLEEKGLVTIEKVAVRRDPYAECEILPSLPLPLNEEQRHAYDAIKKMFSSPGVLLLFGLTGSGKTELYLQTIADCLRQGKESILLVPEIALTPQTVEHFKSRFGDQISVLHSHLSDGERLDEWNRIHQKEVKIAIGARSALFAPFEHLGLIIVDEEHETSYKQGNIPRYHARDVAVMRGKLENATVVLGTATPSLESFYNVKRGKYHLAKLTYRVEQRRLPRMEIVDMCVEATVAGKPQIFSRRLVQLAHETLDSGEQMILFLNRRGYARHVQCLQCGYSATCEDCNIPYTYHRSLHRLMCHLCGSILKAPDSCPSCKKPTLSFGGIGTERVEIAARKVFPYARITRMDSDVMTKKKSYRETLTAFRAGEYDILIGTQMIAKGLHFPNVTLVGIIYADQGLNTPDFRAGERTFQLLVQVAGRSGRGDVEGHVIIQTYTPYHPVLLSATSQDFEAFYDYEIEHRKQLKLPPIYHMVLVRFKGEIPGEVEKVGRSFRSILQQKLPSFVNISPLIPSPIPKQCGKFFYQLYLNTERISLLSRLMKQIKYAFRCPKNIAILIDIDPFSLS